MKQDVQPTAMVPEVGCLLDEMEACQTSRLSALWSAMQKLLKLQTQRIEDCVKEEARKLENEQEGPFQAIERSFQSEVGELKSYIRHLEGIIASHTKHPSNRAAQAYEPASQLPPKSYAAALATEASGVGPASQPARNTCVIDLTKVAAERKEQVTPGEVKRMSKNEM